MKNIIIIAVFFFSFLAVANSQMLLNADDSSTRDTIALAGSTDAGTSWFLNKGYDKLFVEVFDGALWWTFEVAVPTKTWTKFMVQCEGSDTTLRVRGYDPDGVSVQLPMIYQNSSTWVTHTLNFGGPNDGTSDPTRITVCASPVLIKFRGYYKRDL
jgi:hypothetical protein